MMCRSRMALVLAGMVVGNAGLLAAQQPVEPVPAAPSYNSIVAGQEAYRRGEQERLQAIGSQLRTIDRMAWLSGQVTLYPYPALEAVYAYGGRRAYRAAVSVPYLVPRYASPAGTRLGVFEPWPLVPGDIYGYPHLARAPQPIGHETIVTGPGSSLYRPVYPAPAPVSPPAPPAPAPPPAPSPEPPAAEEPQAISPESIPTPPPVEQVAPRPSKIPAQSRGPREF